MSIELKKYMNPENIKGPTMDTIVWQEEKQLKNLNSNINISLNETFIKRAQNIGLTILEKEFGLKVDNTLTIEERRKRLIGRKRGAGTTTVEAIKNICNAYVDKTEVVECTTEYWFKLILEVINYGFKDNLQGLYEIINTIKPAHLEVKYSLQMSNTGDIKVFSYGTVAENISVFPWTESEILSKMEVKIPALEKSSLETITVYAGEAKKKVSVIATEQNELLTTESNELIGI